MRDSTFLAWICAPFILAFCLLAFAVTGLVEELIELAIALLR